MQSASGKYGGMESVNSTNVTKETHHHHHWSHQSVTMNHTGFVERNHSITPPPCLYELLCGADDEKKRKKDEAN